MKAIILDTETTGLSDPRPVEIAWMAFAEGYDDSIHCQRFNPGKPIEFGAMATHHITNDDVVSCPSYTDFRLPEGVQYIIGHNVDFDLQVIRKCGPVPHVMSICTLAMSRMLYPHTDSHKLGAMLYMLDLAYAKEHAHKAHSAADDVEMTANLLLLLTAKARADGYQIKSLADLHSFSEMARIPTVMPFGKYKGIQLEKLPSDYIQWLRKQPDIDHYLLKALQRR